MKAKNKRLLIISIISFLFTMTLLAGCASSVSEVEMDSGRNFAAQGASDLIGEAILVVRTAGEDALTSATIAAREREAAKEADAVSGATEQSLDPNGEGVDATSGATGQATNPGEGGVDVTSGATGQATNPGEGGVDVTSGATSSNNHEDDEDEDDDDEDDEDDEDDKDKSYHKKEDDEDEEDDD